MGTPKQHKAWREKHNAVKSAAQALGRRRMAKMTRDERTQHQRRAALARWAKARERELKALDDKPAVD